MSSFYELNSALTSSISDNQLSYIRMNRNVHPFDLDVNTSSPFIYHLHNGSSLTVVSSGGRTADVSKVLSSLDQSLSSAIDLFHVTKIHPLCPEPIFTSLEKTGKLLVIEDHSTVGSLYSQILSSSSESCCRFQHFNLSLHSELIRGYGTYQDLTDTSSISSSAIKSKIIELIP